MPHRTHRAHAHEARQPERDQIRELILLSACSDAARAKALRELEHLGRAAPGSWEAGAIRNWIEWMLELPWTSADPDPSVRHGNFSRVAEVLERSHSGLGEVKNRVIEFLAVRQLRGLGGGTILCFAGPPGTGKTSMARAVADALGRHFVHVPMGGVREDVELRGAHLLRAGATAGRVLQGLFRAGRVNPVVLLDEIDKLETSGPAAGVLMEVLDPEQNREFLDQYLGVPYDLSQCVFLATANDVEALPEALLDRLEVIRFESYSEGEKLAVAREHLLPRARALAGLTASQFTITAGAMRSLVRNYTQEAGVRHLQRTLDSLARKAAVSVVRGKGELGVKQGDLLGLLGPANVDEELHLKRPRVGVTTGLAWTAAGGTLLPVEALAMPGEGRTILTGSVGEVMRESVQAAISYVRTRFAQLGIAPDRLETLDLHLHFPSGATPKDGPSAGIAVATSLVSLLTGIPVRHDIAMSGEMSLHGAVLPVGGLRDKLLAAVRAGIREAIVPARNGEEVLRLPSEIRRALSIRLVHDVSEVFSLALRLGRRPAIRTALEEQAGQRRVARGSVGSPRQRKLRPGSKASTRARARRRESDTGRRRKSS
jgi:ATP-dependent Lon protease